MEETKPEQGRADDRQQGNQEATAQHAPDVQPTSEHGPKRKQWPWDRIFAVASLIFDFVVAVTAAVGGVIVYDQLKLAREANELTRQTLMVTERPWLKMSVEVSGPMTYIIRKRASTRLRVTVTNTGN